MDRRQFVKTAATAAAAGAALGTAPLALAAPPRGGAGAAVAGGDTAGKAIVSLCRNAALADMADDQKTQTLKYLTHLAVQDAVGGATAIAAWQKLFTEKDIVAVKLSCLAPQFAPHPAIVQAVVDGLKSCGIPEEHIILYDKEDRDLAGAGYEPNATGKGVQCYGTIGGGAGEPGYEEHFTLRNDTSFCLSKIVTRTATAIVNVPVIKHHDYAGISCALKNHFGSISNPSKFHLIGGCNPAVADVNTAIDLRSKQRLIVCDALRLLFDRGPAFHAECVFPYHAVMASTDPVALDFEAMQLVETCRQAKGLPPLAEGKFPPAHVATAAKYGLGTNDPQAIHLAVRDLGG